MFESYHRIEVAVKEAFEKDAKEEMLDEAKTMIRVSKHDHIVNFQGVCVHNDLVYLLLEFCSLGRIDNFLQKYAKQMESKLANQDFTDLVQWGADIADGMEFLVSENIIHVSQSYSVWKNQQSFQPTYFQTFVKLNFWLESEKKLF